MAHTGKQNVQKISGRFNFFLTLLAFYTVILQLFLSSVNAEGSSKIMIQFSSIIAVYGISYVVYSGESAEKMPRIGYWLYRCFDINIILLSLLILLLSIVYSVDASDNVLKMAFTFLHSIVLFAFSFILPAAILVLTTITRIKKKRN